MRMQMRNYGNLRTHGTSRRRKAAMTGSVENPTGDWLIFA